MKIAYIGLGAMGWPIAGHIAKHYPSRVFNRSHHKALEHAQQFGTQASTYPDLTDVDMVISCLPTTKEVLEVSTQALPYLKAGTLWVDSTSGDPSDSQALAASLATSGIGYLDACLTGGTSGAQAARSTVICGGTVANFERALPVLQTFGQVIKLVGPVGAGHSLKTINNALLATHLLVLAEGMAALAKQGVNLELALEVLNASTGRSRVSEEFFGPQVLSRNFTQTFALGLMDKDLGIATKLLAQLGTPSMMMGTSKQLSQIAKRQIGDHDQDYTAMVKLIEQWAGVELAAKSNVPEVK